MAEVTLAADQGVELKARAIGVDGSDQTAQLASGVWSDPNALVLLAAQDAQGLIQEAITQGIPGVTTVTLVATDAAGNQFSADITVTVTPVAPPPPPAIASVEIVAGEPHPIL